MTTGLESIDAKAPIWPQGSVVALEVATSIFCRSAVLRACYSLSRCCHVFVAEGGRPDHVRVFLRPKKLALLETIAGEFANELVDQQLRMSVLAETGAIRELIVAHALAEGNLLAAEDEPHMDSAAVGQDDR